MTTPFITRVWATSSRLYSIDIIALYNTFSAFGNVHSCKVVTNEENSFTIGFGFVPLNTQESADLAIQVNGMMLNSKKVYMDKFILVSATPMCTSKVCQKVWYDYQCYGRKRTMPRHGFINFQSHDVAVESLNGSIIGTCKVSLHVKYRYT